jgi:hypothetical protein
VGLAAFSHPTRTHNLSAASSGAVVAKLMAADEVAAREIQWFIPVSKQLSKHGSKDLFSRVLIQRRQQPDLCRHPGRSTAPGTSCALCRFGRQFNMSYPIACRHPDNREHATKATKSR